MRYIIFFLAVLLTSCQHEPTENQLTVTVEKIPMRASPGMKGAAVGTLRKGDKLIDLGEVSHFESPLEFDKVPMRTPWIKVQTADKKQGWVFAGAVQPAENTAGWLLQKRLDCYFGHAFAGRLNALNDKIGDIRTEEEFAALYRATLAMRDTMVYEMSRRAEPDGRPDHFWMAAVLPGFIHQRAYPGGPPNLFCDYRFWLKKAQKSSGTADDDFLETCLLVFPQDSIESIFPVWKFQLSELISVSQLGMGLHLKVLQEIDKTRAKSHLFDPELMRIKDAVLEDIHDKNTRFWQDTPLILKDLDELMANPPACLTEAESSALRPRRVMLADAAGNGIRVNMRATPLPATEGE